MVPFLFHVPPRESAESQIGCTDPDIASTFFTFPCAKNPMKRPSGDQNGKVASSVWGIIRGATESRGLTQSEVPPFGLAAINAMLLPSGEIATELLNEEPWEEES